MQPWITNADGEGDGWAGPGISHVGCGADGRHPLVTSLHNSSEILFCFAASPKRLAFPTFVPEYATFFA